jgi:hypothetical protein
LIQETEVIYFLGEAKIKHPTPITTGKSPDRMSEQNVPDHVVYAGKVCRKLLQALLRSGSRAPLS